MTVGEASLPDLLSRLPAVRWFMAKVDSVQASEHALTLVYRGGTVAHCAYLASYTPAVGDVVHVITDQANGLLVLGKEVLRTPTPPPTPGAVSTRAPSGSSTYFAQPAPAHWSGTEVRQGPGESGAWFFPAHTFDYLAGVPLALVEIQMTITPADGILSLVLHRNADTSSPFAPVSPVYLHHVMDWMTDWHKIPLGWAADLANGTALGIGLASDLYSAVVVTGGTLRFTPL